MKHDELNENSIRLLPKLERLLKIFTKHPL